MKRILICDVETTGLDHETDSVVELAVLLWDVEHATTIASFSHLVRASANPAEPINQIPTALLRQMGGYADPWPIARSLACQADAAVAHNATFDKGFVAGRLDDGASDPLLWVCSDGDIRWPREAPNRSLIALALAHGVPVTAAHRALTDCRLIASMLERCAELGHDVGQMLDEALAHAIEPKFRFVADTPFERNDEVRAAGFRFHRPSREWWRVMTVGEARALPFPTRQGPSA